MKLIFTWILTPSLEIKFFLSTYILDHTPHKNRTSRSYDFGESKMRRLKWDTHTSMHA